MTLIAAFRCGDGVVLCADSQETRDIPERGSYRVNVDKLERRDAGEYDVVIGGAGDGPLVDSFGDLFAQMVRKWQGSYQRTKALSAIKRFVRGFHQTEVALSPAHPDDKNLDFVVCLRNKNSDNLSLWKISNLHVSTVSDLTLLGWEEALYWREAKRLYHLKDAVTAPSSSEAILLGVHLFSLAKDTSNVISGDTRILVVRSDGVHVLNPGDVKELEARTKTFECLSSVIFLALPDVTISHTELKQYLRDFQEIALALHNHFMLYIAQTAIERLKALPGYPQIKDHPEDPYLQLPAMEQLQKDLTEDEAINAIGKMAKAYRWQEEAEIGWEQFTSAERHQLVHDQNKAAHALERMVKLNRAFYESGQYGPVGSQEAIATRQGIARSIHTANEELIRLLELTPGTALP